MECLRLNHPKAKIKEKYKEFQKLKMEYEEMIDRNDLKLKKSEAMKVLVEALTLFQCKGTFCTVAAAIINLDIAILEFELDKTEVAEQYFKKCIDSLGKEKLTENGILPAVIAYNYLGQINMCSINRRQALPFLEEAEDLYIKFTGNIKLDPVHMTSIMGNEDIREETCAKSILEKEHTSTLQYLARFYKIYDDGNFIRYCHKMLVRQLNENKQTQNLNYIDWAANATLIAECFLKQDKFPQARHHLAAASCILEKYLEILKAKGSR